MDPLAGQTTPRSGRVLAMVRGALIGLIAVAAVGVWAVNFEVVLAGRAAGGTVGTVLRIILCDAVPLATLCAIYRGLGRDESIEGILRGIVRTIGWCCGGFLVRHPSADLADEL